jgi:hypothetical protein
VECSGPRQQIEHWHRTLSGADYKSCDKRSKFDFKESDVLVDNVPCKPKQRGATDVFQGPMLINLKTVFSF